MIGKALRGDYMDIEIIACKTNASEYLAIKNPSGEKHWFKNHRWQNIVEEKNMGSKKILHMNISVEKQCKQKHC